MNVESNVPEDIELYLQNHQEKTLLRFVTIGSVDDGKSTLIGRLLHDTQGVYEDHLADAKVRSQEGEMVVDLSRLTDGLRAEREQGITIDVAYRYFSTEKRKFIIADTPGHIQYTRNMATGASTANVAIILVDARYGVLAQSKRHAKIASLLGIPFLAVAINKMDLCAFDENCYNEICADLLDFTKDLPFSSVDFFPVSALNGDNVVSKSPNTPWYKGKPILDYLESVPIEEKSNTAPFRFSVQYVVRPHLDYRGFAGQIQAGTISVGDKIQIIPSNVVSEVVGIDFFESTFSKASYPQSVTLRLKDEVDISRGDLIVKTEELPKASMDWQADLVWLHETTLQKGKSYLLKHCSRWSKVTVDRIDYRLEKEFFHTEMTESLELNDIARVHVHSSRAIHGDSYQESRWTGAFILVDPWTNHTVAAGMLVQPSQREEIQWESLIQSALHETKANDPSEEKDISEGVAVHILSKDIAFSKTLSHSLQKILQKVGIPSYCVENVENGQKKLVNTLISQGCILMLPQKTEFRPSSSFDLVWKKDLNGFGSGSHLVTIVDEQTAPEKVLLSILNVLQEKGVIGA